MVHTVSCAAALALLLVSTAFAEEGKTWSQRFPAIKPLATDFDKIMTAPDGKARVELLYRLQPRNSRDYPPFLKAVLKDPDARVRFEALHRLWVHHHFLTPNELPASFEVPFFGPFEWQKPESLARLRKQAESQEAAGGWAIHALGIIGDREAIRLANNLLDSRNVFTRFSAAVALMQLGKTTEGTAALRTLVTAPDDASGFYHYRAAECLYRFGDRKALELLIAVYESGVRDGYGDGPRQVLEDLTGQRFASAAEWRKWWQAQK